VSEVTWISVTDAAPQFGMTPGAIMNLISRDKFPVPTYKLGKKRVIDLAVLRAFFEAKREIVQCRRHGFLPGVQGIPCYDHRR
jgi:hypothetical protein